VRVCVCQHPDEQRLHPLWSSPPLLRVRAAVEQVLEKHGSDGQQPDVWSVGVVMYVLLAGYLPFNETTMATLFLKIKNGTPP